MTQRDKWAKRKCVVKYFEFADAMREEAERQNFQIQDAIDVEFKIQMPNSWSKKKRDAMLGRPHQQKPDIDNLVKSCLDALLKDDSGVHTVNASKCWGTTGQIIVHNINRESE